MWKVSLNTASAPSHYGGPEHPIGDHRGASVCTVDPLNLAKYHLPVPDKISNEITKINSHAHVTKNSVQAYN